MSSLAQEESRSISENVTWGHRKRFQDGKVYMPYGNFLGYNRGEDGEPVINPEQAEIVRCHGIKAKLTRFKKTLQNATLSQDFDRATLRALCQRIQITPSGEASVIFADGTKLPLQH